MKPIKKTVVLYDTRLLFAQNARQLVCLTKSPYMGSF